MTKIEDSTEKLRDDVLDIRKDLRDGKLSNAVARTLLQGSKIALDSLKTEMEAARLGADFHSVPLHEAERNSRRLKSVA